MSYPKSKMLEYVMAQCGLADQSILVVGGGGTIGDDVITELALRGAVVVPTRRTQKGVDASVEMIREATGAAESCPGGLVMSMSDEQSIATAITELPELLGNSLNGVVINAGAHDSNLIVGPEDHFHETKPDDVLTFMKNNLFGQREVLRLLSKRYNGQKGFTSALMCSVAPLGLSRVLDYRVAKAGWEQLVQWLALDHGRKYGQRCVGIAPGFVNDGKPDNQNSFAVKDPTRFNAICDRIPLNPSEPFNAEFPGWATGAEIADVTASVFSRAFRYVTGDIIKVDGGFSVNALGNAAL